MADMVLDATVLIDLSLARAEAERFVVAAPESRLLIHPAAEAEVLVGAKNRAELRAIGEMLDHFGRVKPLPQDFDHCLAFVRRFTLSHGVGWPDCLMAATCLRLRLPLVTLNDNHFRPIRGLRVIRPY